MNLTPKELKDLMVQEVQNYIEFLKEVYQHLGDDHPTSKDVLERSEDLEGSFLSYYDSEDAEDFSTADHCRFLLEEESDYCSGLALSSDLEESVVELIEEKASHIQNLLDDLSSEFD